MTDKIMQKITPFLWFDNNAQEAVKFYVSIFSGAKIINQNPAFATFEIWGLEFMALNGGPVHKFTPAISFFVNCKSEEEINGLWKRLSEDGKVMMEFGKYPFAEKYGWIADKYGVSWQLMLAEASNRVTPLLMYVGKVAGKAEEAMKFYTSVFSAKGGDSRVVAAIHYENGEMDREENIKHGKFVLAGQEFMAMDSSLEHHFSFSEAISLFVRCEKQEEVDYFWEKMIGGGGEESQCGWLKDKFGVSWQVIPRRLNELLADEDKEKAGRAMQAMLGMKKLVVQDLEKAFNGK